MDPDSDDAVASPRSQSAGEFSHAHISEGRCRMTTPPKPMVWVKADSADMEGKAPSARSGHTAVAIGKSKLILFGGFADKKFLSGIFVYDVEKRLWYTPKCSGVGFYRQAEPSPRAFHIAACIGSDMFIFGGRSGAKSLGDSWVLNTDVWRWSELRCSGDLPCPRQFAATAVIGGNKIIVHGGWDGNKGLSDTYIFDTSVLQWKKLLVDGLLPPPRCGHAAIVIDKRLLIYGGRGGNGVIMGDLWALKGTYEKDNERASWTQFNLPEQAYSARSGHSVTSSGSHLLLFGGHGTQSSPSGCDIYHNECIILYRGFTKWESFRTINEPPPPRAYHSLTCTGLRFLLFGGFDGINTFGDMWWLVSEDDPIAKRDMVPKAESDSTDVQKFALMESDVTQSDRIMLYIYKHFEQKGYNICFSLRRILFNGMYIIPSARCQLPGDCAYHATCGNMECHYKRMFASKTVEKGRIREEFRVRLSHAHLKEMVLQFMGSEEGRHYKPGDRLEVCLLMAQRHGIVSDEDYEAGCPPEAYRQLTDAKKKNIPHLLREKGAVLTSFRISEEYLQLLPYEIYRYRPERALARAAESHSGQTGHTLTYDAHCVFLISPGYAFPDPTEAAEQTAGAVREPEVYYEYVNSYSPGWGVDGCGAVYAESLRKTYRIRVEDR